MDSTIALRIRSRPRTFGSLLLVCLVVLSRRRDSFLKALVRGFFQKLLRPTGLQWFSHVLPSGEHRAFADSARAPRSLNALPEQKYGILESDTQLIKAGVKLICLEEVDIFETMHSWDAIGTLAEGCCVVAAGPCEMAEGHCMVPIEPEGAVEAAHFQFAEKQVDNCTQLQLSQTSQQFASELSASNRMCNKLFPPDDTASPFHTAVVQHNCGILEADAHLVKEGVKLICLEEVDIFENLHSWDSIGILAEHSLAIAAGPSEIAEGIRMIPIKPSGAVEAAHFRLAEGYARRTPRMARFGA